MDGERLEQGWAELQAEVGREPLNEQAPSIHASTVRYLSGLTRSGLRRARHFYLHDQRPMLSPSSSKFGPRPTNLRVVIDS